MTDGAETLATQSCTPCRGGVAPLDFAEAEVLRAGTPEWTLCDGWHRLERRFGFKNYAAAFAFVRRISEIAQAERHHPDVSFGWGYATVSLQTHAVKGLHANDFILAAKIDEIR